ncbi:MAG TPA: ABC transporter substrate-binding protein [Chloroflexota bacterium]|nr:ABC transporter substrate-binding protein [Chloroflexota bacterium]
MRRRYWRLGTLLTWGVGALLLAACGGAAAPAAAPQAAAPAPPAAQPAAPSQPAAPTASAAAPPAEPVKLTVPYTPVGGPMAPLWIGVEEHLFEKQGLDVTAQFVSGSSPISQGMTAGEYEIGVANGGVAALNKLNGGDIIMIGAHAPYFSIDAWAKPEIQSIADLKGKTIGVTRLGSSTQFAATAMLASAGLAPTDATLLQTGGLGESLAALFSLQADAVMLAPPQNLEAKKAGFRQVAVLSELGQYGLFPETAILAREAILTDPARRDVGIRFLRAFSEGLRLAKTDADLTKRVSSKYTQIDDDEILQATFDFYSKYFPDTLRIDEQTVRNLLTFLDDPKAKDADPRQFYSNELVDAASQ